MTSLSKGIIRPDSENGINLEVAPLEAFSLPVKKTEETLQKEPVKEGKQQSEEKTPEKLPEPSENGEAHILEKEKEEARAIFCLAKEQSRNLLETARKQAEEIKKAAEKEGYEEGWKRGRKEGEEAARQEASEQQIRLQQEFSSSLSQALRSVEQEKEACLKKYLEELKDVAVSVGEKVIRISLKSSGDVIRRMIETETEKLKKMAWVRIYMEHSDYETMIQADSEVLSHLARLSDNVKFVVMEQGTGGSCIIEMPDEIIDISVDTQMENIRKLVGNIHF